MSEKAKPKTHHVLTTALGYMDASRQAWQDLLLGTITQVKATKSHLQCRCVSKAWAALNEFFKCSRNEMFCPSTSAPTPWTVKERYLVLCRNHKAKERLEVVYIIVILLIKGQKARVNVGGGFFFLRFKLFSKDFIIRQMYHQIYFSKCCDFTY